MNNEDFMQSLNKNGKNLQVNVQVITLEDNLDHPYFSLIDLAKENSSPIGIAIMEAPYTPYISNYWIAYQGIVVISFDMTDLKKVNTNSLSFFENIDQTENFNFQQRIQNEYYNYSLICKISRFKQKGNKFVIYFEDLGWKFLQKVPMEFRKQYIAGQPLDNAFQAMCEFLDVQYAYSIEDLHEYNFSVDGYSIEKDGQVIEDVETVLSEWGPEVEEDSEKNSEENDLEDPKFENEAVIDLDKENKDNKNYEVKTEEQNNTDNTEKNTDDIQEKIEKYQEDFDKKILDLFIGNSYYDSNLTDPILNYNNITVTPVTTNSSTITEENDEAKKASDELLDKAQSGVVLQNITFTND